MKKLTAEDVEARVGRFQIFLSTVSLLSVSP